MESEDDEEDNIEEEEVTCGHTRSHRPHDARLVVLWLINTYFIHRRSLESQKAEKQPNLPDWVIFYHTNIQI